jgi:hypothetical protein
MMAASAQTLPLKTFRSKTFAMSAPKKELLQAVELALAGKWDAAHEVVQQYEDDATAAWIHAVLHKVEGDLVNARYWYRRADRMDRVADEPRAELAAIQAELTTDGQRSRIAGRIQNSAPKSDAGGN